MEPKSIFPSERTVPVKAEDALSQARWWIMHPHSELSRSVRSQAGCANTGQHLQHKLGNVEQRASKLISALKPDVPQLTPRPVWFQQHLKPSKRLICWKRLISVWLVSELSVPNLCACIMGRFNAWTCSHPSSLICKSVWKDNGKGLEWCACLCVHACTCFFWVKETVEKGKCISEQCSNLKCVFCVLDRVSVPKLAYKFPSLSQRFHLLYPSWVCARGDVRAAGFLALGELDWGKCDAEKQMVRYCHRPPLSTQSWSGGQAKRVAGFAFEKHILELLFHFFWSDVHCFCPRFTFVLTEFKENLSWQHLNTKSYRFSFSCNV